MTLEDGIVGLSKVISTKRLSAETITDYTKIVFKERLEILQSFMGDEIEYDRLKKIYPDIINLANNYYDIVLVDLDSELDKEITDIILANSNIIVANISQRLSSIDKFMELREKISFLKSKKILLLIGRYDKFSKYTIKNISRYMGEKNKVSTIPYNTLFFEACEEAKVPDLFLRIRSVDDDDRNKFFMDEVKRTIENITYRLHDLAIKR